MLSKINKRGRTTGSAPDRLGRSVQDLISIVSGLRKRGIGFTLLHESLDTTTPGGRLVFHVFAALAESIRELIVQGANEGLDTARARGARLGRPPAMTEEQVRHARDLLARPENTVTSIAKLLGVSRNTIYNYVSELKGGHLALAEATSTPELPQPTRSEDRSPPFAAGDRVLTGTPTWPIRTSTCRSFGSPQAGTSPRSCGPERTAAGSGRQLWLRRCSK
ncbi:hypothetical protein KNE206_75850 [Kitasatospora sp. NE20-6]|uniref:recombinase family protein n=1 Tax=Kitasatospora sp. NE20-6 TaxID=2859066 RepID=UPI0034DCA7D8